MSRPMFHAVRTLSVALGLLTVGLIVAHPETIAAPQALPAAVSPVVAPATASPAKPHARHRHARVRESVALPFFSFAQGLRRNDRS